MENVVILGSGIAGLTAAIYAARAGLKPVVVSGKEEGGQLMITTTVENYPGFPEGIMGPELISKAREQAKRFGARFVDGDAEKVEMSKGGFTITTSEGRIEAKAVIVATGASARTLGIESEKKYWAMGVHTCATCLPVGANIIANNSPKPINKIELGQKVLTHDGTFQNVSGKGSRKYKGKLIKILPRHFHEEPTHLTPEHLVLVTDFRRGSGKDYRKVEFDTSYWLPAGQLTKNHVLLYPVVKETKNYGSIQISEYLGLQQQNGVAYYSYETHSARRIPNIIEIDNDFMRLVGYYLADGTLTSRGINFYFGPKDLANVKDVIEIMRKIFNYDAKVKKEGSVYRIECYAGIIRDLFQKLTGKYSYGKALPHWFIYLPTEKQAELIKGFWRGDGAIKKLTFSLVTNSPTLASQFKTILIRLGVIPTIYKQSKESLNKTKNMFKGREIKFKHDRYQIEIGGQWLQRIGEILGVEHSRIRQRKNYNSFAWIRNGFVYLPISEISEKNYEGEVYNIAVENNNTYVTPGAIVHNCDGYFYKGKDVVVVGGGDSAMEESLFLANQASRVTIIHRRDSFRASQIMQDRVKANKKISVVLNSLIEEVIGDGKKVTGAKIRNSKTNKRREMKTDAVFLAIGHIPNTKMMGSLAELDEQGYIKAENTKTKTPGLFAAGDCADRAYRQAATAAGSGCQAAIEAERYLGSLRKT